MERETERGMEGGREGGKNGLLDLFCGPPPSGAGPAGAEGGGHRAGCKAGGGGHEVQVSVSGWSQKKPHPHTANDLCHSIHTYNVFSTLPPSLPPSLPPCSPPSLHPSRPLGSGSMYDTFSDEFGMLDFQRSQHGSGMSQRSQVTKATHHNAHTLSQDY